MSLAGFKFTSCQQNGKIVRRARATDKGCSFQRWAQVKDNRRECDVVIRAIVGPVLTKTNGKVAKCTNGFPLLETATCCWQASAPTKSLHHAWKVDKHDQVGYLTNFLRHIRTSTCTACRFPECFAPAGYTPYLQIGEDGPVCKLHLVRCLAAALYCFF